MNSVVCVSEFVGLFYAKYFLTSSLSSQTALKDLRIRQDLLEYRSFRLVLAEACLQPIQRLLWYFTPQLVVLALADTCLGSAERESMAQRSCITLSHLCNSILEKPASQLQTAAASAI